MEDRELTKELEKKMDRLFKLLLWVPPFISLTVYGLLRLLDGETGLLNCT